MNVAVRNSNTIANWSHLFLLFATTGVKRTNEFNMILYKNLDFLPGLRKVPCLAHSGKVADLTENSTRSKSKALIKLRFWIHLNSLVPTKKVKPLRLPSISDRWGSRGWRIVTLQMLSLKYVIRRDYIFVSLFGNCHKNHILDVVRSHILNSHLASSWEELRVKRRPGVWQKFFLQSLLN